MDFSTGERARIGSARVRALLVAAVGAAALTSTGMALPAHAAPNRAATERGAVREASEVSPPRSGHRRLRHQRRGFSLTRSSERPYWACPEGLCEAIVDPPPVKRTARGRVRFALPAGGPLLEGDGEKGGFDPQELQSAYDIPTTGGEGQTIAIVDAYGYPTAEEDLAKYRARYELAPCTKANGCFRKVNQNGEERNYPPPPFSGEDWEGESALDIEMASAACPGCHIILAEASSASTESLAATVETAARLGASEISNSYGLPEQECAKTCATLAPDYEHLGVLVTAAAGDSGYDNSLEGDQSPNFPAALPSVVAVGATSLHRAANARGWSEEAWSAGGSGCTASWQKPVWQQDTACATRMDDDVAAVGACESPVSVYSTHFNGWEDLCGTSVSAPLVAGIEAHASEYARSLPGADAFYEDPQALFDVTAGENGTCTPPADHNYYCHAQAGYDGPTGNGTPDGPLELSNAPGPSVATLPAADVTGTAATLQGTVDPQGNETTYRFEYGTGTSYGQSAPAPEASAGSSRTQQQVSQGVAGLEPDTTYHYRIAARNSDGTSYGADSAFTTAEPVVTSVTPGLGPAAGASAVTIDGANFDSASAVEFGGRAAESFTVSSSGSIDAVAPPGTGTVDVTVSTPAGTSATGPSDRFAYGDVGPVLDWGLNDGALGDGAFANSSVPVEVSELPEAVALAAGYQESLALLGNGTVMAWGENRNGSLGNGSYGASDLPVEVCAASTRAIEHGPGCPDGPYLSEVTAIAAGGFHSLALLRNGTVVAWGANGRGQLGVDSEIATSDLPAPVCASKEPTCKPEHYRKRSVG